MHGIISVPLVYFFIFVPMLQYLNYHCFFMSDNSILSLPYPPYPFVFKIALPILGPLDFHINFRNRVSISTNIQLYLDANYIWFIFPFNIPFKEITLFKMP